AAAGGDGAMGGLRLASLPALRRRGASGRGLRPLRRRAGGGGGVSRLRPRSRRGGIWLALAGAAGLVAVLVTLRASAQPGDGGTVLVARAALPAGALIDAATAAEALVGAPVPAGLPLAG